MLRLSDQELEQLRPPCPGHEWGMWYTAPSVLEKVSEITTLVHPQIGKRHRRCKHCDRTQIGRKVEGKIVPGEII